MNEGENSNGGYLAEVERLRAEGVPGRAGRLRELFDYLAERGPDGTSATQAEIGQAVFGQAETEADDATVRVYIHRLRKKLEDHYAAHPPQAGQAELEIPAGIYALKQVEPAENHVLRPPLSVRRKGMFRYWPVFAAMGLLAAFLAGLALERGLSRSVNALWQPFIESERPVLVVVGDYYIFGEIDPVRPELSRLIRDFRIDSPQDLELLQEEEPERYGFAEDVGLNYLPVSSAYALQEVVPVLATGGKPVEVIASSDFEVDMFRRYDVVYLGLLSGMGRIEDFAFREGQFRVGESYDEIVDEAANRAYISDEARNLTAPIFYRDYAYIARFEAPGGALVAVVASQRDTGLRGMSPIVTGDLPDDLDEVAQGADAFEALFQITGQQGADLNERMIVARARQ